MPIVQPSTNHPHPLQHTGHLSSLSTLPSPNPTQSIHPFNSRHSIYQPSNSLHSPIPQPIPSLNSDWMLPQMLHLLTDRYQLFLPLDNLWFLSSLIVTLVTNLIHQTSPPLSSLPQNHARSWCSLIRERLFDSTRCLEHMMPSDLQAVGPVLKRPRKFKVNVFGCYINGITM